MPSTPRAMSRRIIEAAGASESCESAISTSVPCAAATYSMPLSSGK